MKRSVWGALALAVTALGCATGPSDTPGLFVTVYDSDGRLMTADHVYWADPDHVDSRGFIVHVRGTCVDAGCTRWTWTELPVGDFEVSGYEDKLDEEGFSCPVVHRYGTRKMTRNPDEMLVLALRLETFTTSCND